MLKISKGKSHASALPLNSRIIHKVWYALKKLVIRGLTAGEFVK